jgi:hypothetical protein
MTRQTPDRRQFLASIGASAATLALAGCAANGSGLTTTPHASAWDDSWTQRLGRHRTLFDVPELDATPGVGQVAPVMDAYHEVLGTSDADLGFVLIIRHMAVPLFFNDELWAKYDIGASLKYKDPKTSAPFKYNPVRPLIARAQQRGVIVLGCSTAVVGFAGMTAQKAKTPVAAVKDEVMAGIMPGVILQPNGLYALARAQNAGCGFMR